MASSSSPVTILERLRSSSGLTSYRDDDRDTNTTPPAAENDEVRGVKSLYEGKRNMEGKRHGSGILRYVNGKIEYEGNWKNDLYDGSGKHYFISGEVEYDGDFKDGKCDGEGTLLLPGGSIRYKGSWRVARFQGDGVLYFPDGDGILYEGEFKDGLPNGHGKFYHENGNLRCLGSFQEGKLHGVAKCYDQEGRLEYDGSHDNGLAHGLGKAYTPEDGNLLYDGEFKSGIPPFWDAFKWWRQNIVVSTCNYIQTVRDMMKDAMSNLTKGEEVVEDSAEKENDENL